MQSPARSILSEGVCFQCDIQPVCIVHDQPLLPASKLVSKLGAQELADKAL